MASYDEIDQASTDGYASLALAADIQTTGSRSKSAEMVALVTGDPARRDAATAQARILTEEAITEDQVAAVRGADAVDGAGLLFDAARDVDGNSERTAVADAMTGWQRYQTTVDVLRQAAVEAAPGIALTQANPAFAGFNVAVESLLGDTQARFLDRLDDGRGALSLLPLGPLAAALFAAVLVLAGFQARINEYG
jgi:hypothetical protein